MAAVLARAPANRSIQRDLQEIPQASESLSTVFRKLVTSYEERPPSEINIKQISLEYNANHRRVYDFFNFLSYFDVCRPSHPKKLVWVGINNIYNVIAMDYMRIEEASEVLSIKELFVLPQGPSLGVIASKFLSLYFYLNVKSLSMRKAAALLFDGTSDIKSLERRIYLVLSFLEILGILKHGLKRSEYDLIMDPKPLITMALSAKKEKIHNPYSISCLLNRYDQAYVSQLFNSRYKEYIQYTSL